ncbi:cytochrome b [Agrobacterium sp. Azo12]|uniref:cytochrome b n=1 Tax=Agrobacterium sp. Azo12 TaxID=3031129 RepID=UPI0023D7C978|nr:cytochrome b/b6 domain-containing protein [Agrobacterium sp. Azo12]MDO5895618.1 cytochrome b/b6 domain-containing protein [Agrobacterium sp. Azo12]
MPMRSYSTVQKLLHWSVAALVAFNLLLPDGMNAWHRLVKHGQVPQPADISAANIHALVGIAILFLVAVRLAIRITSGVPPQPNGQPPIIHRLAGLVHGLLYALLFAMPISGMMAYYMGIDVAGTLHAEVLKTALWLLLGAHVAGALAQHFYFKSDVLRRMTVS